MIVAWKHGNDESVLEIGPSAGLTRWRRAARRRLVNLPMRRYRSIRPAGCDMFSDARSAFGRELVRLLPECDVIHLHWVAGLVDYERFLPAAAELAPIVWTLHDMNSFTGGCHYSCSCRRFTERCGACPQLGLGRDGDLSRRIWRRKARALGRVADDRLTVVGPSRWITDLAARSSLMGRFRTATIANGVDTDIFAPRDKSAARRELNLPDDARIVLFIAHDLTNRRKGAGVLMDALGRAGDVPGLLLVTVGLAQVAPPAGIAHRHVGQVADEATMARLYNAAAVLAIPSQEDNLPNIMLEAMACGLPVVGSAVGGVGETVRSGQTGLLAEAGDSQGLAQIISRLLTDEAARRQMAQNCRQRAQRDLSLSATGEAYMQLYRRLVGE